MRSKSQLNFAAWVERCVNRADEEEPRRALLKAKLREASAAVEAARPDELAAAMRQQEAVCWALANYRPVRASE
ncbi:hypothetical protein ACNRBS_03020 [Ralstonia pseudosolanacearum]|uniref:hypothetical protein n=1 Tax=Ralstonia pseudosolanacearum TaxID=1310165 RepID=UPI001C779945|nr:hypothetical protein [Ralstonia sp. RS642]QWQ13370.1 hypothetical protein KN198_08035 [Ralstonia solanacearum]UZF26542.1 hypothetical protein LGV80_08525 [Ralstonia sp. RS642]